MTPRAMTFDEERFSLNTAWMKKGGQHFEVVVDPDAAVSFKESGSGDVKDIVKSGHIYTDAKKGDLASESLMKEVFGTTDAFVVAEKIIRDGAVQLTKEHRDKVREQKRKRLIALISRNSIDPRTKLPHPVTRIELAFDEAKIKLDEFKRAEDQLDEIVKKLQPILPIRFEQATLHIHLPAQYAAKTFSIITNAGMIKRQDWHPDGSWIGEVEVPAGLATELIDTLNSKTHGAVQITTSTDSH